MPAIELKLAERGGYKLNKIQVENTIEFLRGELKSLKNFRIVDIKGIETVVQADHPEYWDDQSIKSAFITFQVDVAPRGTSIYHLEYGDSIKRSVVAERPIVVEESAAGFEVTMGPTVYRVIKANFNFIDQVVFEGIEFLHAGFRGSRLITQDGRELDMSDDVSFSWGRKGPLKTDLIAKGSYGAGEYPFTSKITFVSRKSWVEIAHQLDNWEGVERLTVESPFSLGKGPVSSAFGARQESSGRSVGWAIVTSENTVDTTIGDMWSEKNDHVRIEVDPNGVQNIIFPLRKQGVEFWFHYLIGAPDDKVNTPAGAMVAKLDLEINRVN